MKDAKKLLMSGVFIVFPLWLVWSLYWSLKLYVSLPDIFAVPDPFAPLYFSSTLSVAFLFVGLTIRTVGVALAIFAAYSYFRKGWVSSVRIMVGAVVILEAIYLISIIPTAWVGPDVNDFVLIPEATIPSLFEAIFVPIPLLMLAIRLRWQGKSGTVAKWAALSGFTYILALFVRFTGQWIATFIQTEKYTSFFGGFPSHGIAYVLDYPLNMLSFVLTVVGLPLLAIYLLATSLPAIRNTGARLNAHRIGFVLTLLGLYFIVASFLLYALPWYVGEKSIWSSFFIGHNVDLWMLALPIIGIPLMFSENGEQQTGQTN
jgi:hypothetical protein